MKEKIIEILDKKDLSLTLEQINELIGEKSKYEEIVQSLSELQMEGKVYYTKREKYMLFKNSHLKIGKLDVTKNGSGYVIVSPDEPDIYIPKKNLENIGALNDDLVAVEITNKDLKNPEGKINFIVNRNLGILVGEYSENSKQGFVKLDDKKLNNMIITVQPDNSFGAVAGHKVIVELVKDLGDRHYDGKITKIICHKDDPRSDMLSSMYRYNFNPVFPEEVMEQVKTIPKEVSKEEIAARSNHDLRDKMIFTIDGADTKDIDDAISLDILENGNYRLGVHIADVSYYIKENSPLDVDANERGTSGYFVDTVVPMLPHELSNGICSLNPEVDRLTLTCDMELDQDMKIVSYDIYESVINSKKKMTYGDVNKILMNNEIPEGYEPFAETLLKMNELARKVRDKVEARGNIDFDVDEAKIIVNENGEPIDVVLRERYDAEKLIERFMILANETVASHMFYQDLPSVYRIHEKPKEDRINKLLTFVSLLGYKITGDRTCSNPKTFQKMLYSFKDKESYPVLSTIFLRALSKAKYSPENVGHYGIASECYTHFTSPIRRYPDNYLHRLIRKLCFENDRNPETIAKYKASLPGITEHSSTREREAMDCEREIEDIYMAWYMQGHIGEEYDAIISSVTGFGMYVSLPNKIEGLVKVESIKGDYYEFNEDTQSLIGKSNKKAYNLGDKIRVKVTNAEKETGNIDFEIVKE